MKKSTGFTIIELMVVVAIVAILTVVAVPSMTAFINERALVADVSRLSSALAFTRSEAVTRALPVSICPSSDGETCTATKSWQGGWIVFQDRNGNLTPDLGSKACAATEDCILRVDDGMKTGSKFTTDQNALGFSAQGERATSSATDMTLCHPDAKRVHRIRIAASGSASVTISEASCI